MPECEVCGGHVTRRFVRVFGYEGEVYGCPECRTFSDLVEGSGAVQPGKPEP